MGSADTHAAFYNDLARTIGLDHLKAVLERDPRPSIVLDIDNQREDEHIPELIDPVYSNAAFCRSGPIANVTVEPAGQVRRDDNAPDSAESTNLKKWMVTLEGECNKAGHEEHQYEFAGAIWIRYDVGNSWRVIRKDVSVSPPPSQSVVSGHTTPSRWEESTSSKEQMMSEELRLRTQQAADSENRFAVMSKLAPCGTSQSTETV